MAKQKRGTRSILFDAPPILTAWASVAGKKESEGPLQAYFDYTNGDTYFGEKTWEKAECHMQEIALETLLQKAGKKKQDVDLVFFRGSAESVHQLQLFSAKHGAAGSGAVWGLLHHGRVSALGLNGRLRRLCRPGGGHDLLPLCLLRAAVPLSLGYGGQRSPTAQWTVTGSGAALVCSKGDGPFVEAATVGTIVIWVSPMPTTWEPPWLPAPLRPSAPTLTIWGLRRRILT